MNQQKNRTFIYWLIALGAFCFAAACAFGYVIFNTILRGSEDQRSTVKIVSLELTNCSAKVLLVSFLSYKLYFL